MIFLADRMVYIPVLEGKAFSMDFYCSSIDSIISNIIFLFGTDFRVDLVLYLSVLIFRSDVGSCSPAASACRFDAI